MIEGFKFVTRHPALITDDFEFELDEYRSGQGDCFLLAHILVHRWTPSVCKRIRHDWEVLRQCVKAPLFAVPKDNDDRWRKFVGMLGFEYLQDTICNNGAARPIFIHVIKDDHVVRTKDHTELVQPDDSVGPAGRRAH